MSNSKNIIAYPYANALFNLACETNDLQSWLKNLENLSKIVVNEQFDELITNPSISSEQIIAVIKQMMGNQFSFQIENLLMTLIQHDRLKNLPEITQVFTDLALNSQNASIAVIESAFPLNERQVLDLEQTLSRKFGKTINAKTQVNKELIGGIKILIDDKVIDASVKGKLANLANQLNK